MQSSPCFCKNALNYTVVHIKVANYFNMAGEELKQSEAD